MGDAEGALPPSKKRAAGRELSRDNPGLDDEDDAPELEAGTFKKASDEVLAARRIVKVRRKETSSTPSSNPFAGIRLAPSTQFHVAPVQSSVTSTEVTAAATNDKPLSEDEKKDSHESKEKEDENTEQLESKIDEAVGESDKSGTEDVKQPESKIDELPKETLAEKESADDKNTDAAGKDENQNDKAAIEGEKVSGSEDVDSNPGGASLSSFQQLSSNQNAFTGLAGTGFSTSTFSFGTAVKDGSPLGSSSVSLFGLKSSQPSFGFGVATNGNSSVATKGEGSSMQEVPTETGEENEKNAFSADSILFEYVDGGWKERGKGEVKVNVSTTEAEKARLLMRARGNYRLILNASLYPDMMLTNMEKKGITFACVNGIGEGNKGLSTFALKFKDSSFVEEFRAAVNANKGKTPAPLKTPENSPGASEG